MLIRGARVAINAEQATHRDIWLNHGRVSFSPDSAGEDTTLNMQGYLVLPGLVNAHDHLELNLFPRLGQGKYTNATRWADDIYRPQESPVKQHAAIPKHLRLAWGALKNLVSGVTTVAHHNDLHQSLVDESFPIRVLRRYGWAHSLHFSSDWQARFQATPIDVPFMIHAAEGVDEEAREEIRILDRVGALGPSTVLIHCVAAGPKELELILRRNSSIVWCPSSNHFTLGATLSNEVLQSGVPISLATDSAMTAQGDLLDELRFANQTLAANRLYSMVTAGAGQILRLPEGFGHVCHGGPADILVMRDDRKTPAETLLSNLPELVIIRGQVALASERFVNQMPRELRPCNSFSVAKRGRYLAAFPVDRLIAETNALLVDGIQLAGKAVAA